MMIALGSSSVAQAAGETNETNETYNIYVFMLFTALAIFGASQAFMNMLKALVNVIGQRWRPQRTPPKQQSSSKSWCQHDSVKRT